MWEFHLHFAPHRAYECITRDSSTLQPGFLCSSIYSGSDYSGRLVAYSGRHPWTRLQRGYMDVWSGNRTSSSQYPLVREPVNQELVGQGNIGYRPSKSACPKLSNEWLPHPQVRVRKTKVTRFLAQTTLDNYTNVNSGGPLSNFQFSAG